MSEIECFEYQCGGEMLAVHHLEDDKLVEIAPWQYGVTNYKSRIRLLKHILQHGHPFSDFVLLNYDQVRELRDLLKGF